MASSAGAQTAPDCKRVRGPERSVVRVLSGDQVLLDDGSIVRLVNILAPKRPFLFGKAPDPSARPPWPPAEAARKALAALVAGRSVRLSFTGLRKDRHGRWLAHLHVKPSDGGPPVWVQQRLVRAGHARVYSFVDSRACAPALLAAERAARRARLGLWRHAAYRIRSAARWRALLAYRYTFQIVEGRVLAVGRARGRIYLNFGPDWRQDFTVIVERRDARRFARAGFDLMALEGQRIRVRGWLIEKNGPAIRATHPEQIERLTGARPRPRLRPRPGLRPAPPLRPPAPRPAPARPGDAPPGPELVPIHGPRPWALDLRGRS